MSQDYRAAAEALINRLRGQGAKPAPRQVVVDAPGEDGRRVNINNPLHCTVIVNNYGVRPGKKQQP